MVVLDIEGKTVEVDDAFLKLSPEEQQRTVEEIAGQMGLNPGREEAKPEPTPQGDGVALNTTAGLNQALYNTLGGPVDLSRWLINKGIEGANYATGSELPTIPSDSVGGSESISSMFGAVGVPEPKNIQAASPEERIARGLGEGVGYTVGPGALVGGAARSGILTGNALDMATKLAGSTGSVGRVAGDAVVGGMSGAGATAAMEATPDKYDALAGIGGGLLGGGVGALLASVPTMAKAGGRMAMEAASPLYQAGRERLAARKLADSATDTSALRGILSEPAEDLVSGSKPTTFQLTGDMGVGGLERGVQTKRPEAFQQRRVDQNAARLSALEGIQADGSPEKVADAARQIVQAVTERAQAAYDDVVTRATAKADDVAAAGRRGVEAAGQRMGLLSDAMGEGVGARTSGEAMRGSLEEARAAAKATERALWQAVDPDGSLALSAGNTRQEAGKLLSELPKSAKPPTGEEAAIFGAVNDYGETIPFSELTALQSRIKTEMRAEKMANGESPAWRRLSMLSKATDADIESAVAGKLQQEAQAVARGEMAQEDTVAFNVQRWVENWNASRSADEGRAFGTADRGAAAGGRSAGTPRLSGTSGQTGFGFGRAASDTGLPRDALEPNFDAGARDRLTAARTATRERAETFDNKTLAPWRRRPSFTAPYDMASESVPGKVFFGRPESARAIDQYRRAVGQGVADQQIEQYAVSRLRQAAFNADGSVNLNKLETWRRSHADALAKLPNLRQQVDELATSARAVADRSDAAARFGKDASKAAQGEIAEAARRQRRMTEAAQRSRLGKVMNADSGEEVVRQVGSIFGRSDAGREMMKLNLATRGNSEAREGLRRAVVDHIVGKFVGNAEAGTSGQGLIKADQFQTFAKNNVGALRSAGFSDEEIRTIQAIAADLRRSNRSVSALRIPGGSNTAQDILAAAQSDAAGSILSRLLGAYAMGGNIVSIVGGKVASTLREAGFQTVDDILADALLNPEKARLLLQRVPARSDATVLNRLADLYAKSGAATAGVSATDRNGAAEKGGRVSGSGNRTHDWIEGRIRAFGGLSNPEVAQAMDIVRSNPGSMKSLMKDLVELERMNLSEGDRGAAVRYLLQSVGQSPNTPASRWMGQRNGNAEKTPLEITVPVGVR